MRRGIDPAAEAVRRAKKMMFNAGLWNKERISGQARAASASLTEKYADFLTAKPVCKNKFGYLRIWSFDVDDDQGFIQAAIELLRGLPNRGLIIDLRDNPGGFIWAAERMLQLFTPNPVSPTKFALRATALTAAMSAARFNQEELGPWADSLAAAPSTGEPYSTHLPITSFEQCNDIGQHYGGPVVAIVDANTYSSGDLFTAGIADNRIGTVVCVGEATGGGGANVWTSNDLAAAMNPAGYPLPALAHGANFTIAMRRAVRTGDADGVLIEDSGIAGRSYSMTERDIFDGNKDLIDFCCKLLEAQPYTQLEVARRAGVLAITTEGLDRIDIYSDGHPALPTIRVKRDGTIRVRLPKGAGALEVVGYSENALLQRRRLPVP
jgi:hypothetical protein